MATGTVRERYSVPLVAIHWIVALCVFGLIPASLVMVRTDEGSTQDRLFSLHGSVGVLVFALMLARVALTAAGHAPPPAAVLTPFERVASQTAHTTLTALLLVTPVIGWLGVSAFGADVDVFGLFTLPSVLAKDEALSEQIFSMYLACCILIAILVVAHVTGAVVHAVRRDGVNQRMHWG